MGRQQNVLESLTEGAAESSGCPREDSLRGANVTLYLQNSAPSNKMANSGRDRDCVHIWDGLCAGELATPIPGT